MLTQILTEPNSMVLLIDPVEIIYVLIMSNRVTATLLGIGNSKASKENHEGYAGTATIFYDNTFQMA